MDNTDDLNTGAPDAPPEDAHRRRMASDDHILQMVSDGIGISVFSEDFVWKKQYAAERFGAILNGVGRITVVEQLVRSDLTPEQRLAMFPSAFHPGSDQQLNSDQRTYQAIADAVVRTCDFAPGSISGKYVEETAKALATITGTSLMAHRLVDGIRFVRTVWLFTYLKKCVRGPGVVGMLRIDAPRLKPSLELTNPYALGTQNEMREQFADVVTYLSLSMPSEQRNRVDSCLGALMSDMERFIQAVKMAALRQQVGPQGCSMEEASRRMRLAKQHYSAFLAGLLAGHDKKPQPFDEALYIHAKTLEVRHYAGMRTILSSLTNQRPALQPFRIHDLELQPPMHLEDIGQAKFLDFYGAAARKMFAREVSADEVADATCLAHHVLRHYLPLATFDLFATTKPVSFVTILAAVLYAVHVLHDPLAHNFEPHVYGQGRVPVSLITAIEAEVNHRHEEYEHLIVDGVDWFRAALLEGTQLHVDVLAMRDAIEQGLAALCATRDLALLEEFLAVTRRQPLVKEWQLACVGLS